jgi:hypothetical protein
VKVPIPSGLYDAVRALVAGKHVREVKASPDVERVVSYVADDVAHYQLQVRQLQRADILPMVATFKEEDSGANVPVLLQVPSLARVKGTYEVLRGLLADSKIPLETVNAQTAHDIFVDRLVEFIAVGASTSSSVADTIVRSNRGGDIVLYAKGYFTSTGTAFGTSNPAQRLLIPPGRYSFGIIDGNVRKYHNIVWDCPTTVRLPLP